MTDLKKIRLLPPGNKKSRRGKGLLTIMNLLTVRRASAGFRLERGKNGTES